MTCITPGIDSEYRSTKEEEKASRKMGIESCYVLEFGNDEQELRCSLTSADSI